MSTLPTEASTSTRFRSAEGVDSGSSPPAFSAAEEMRYVNMGLNPPPPRWYNESAPLGARFGSPLLIYRFEVISLKQAPGRLEAWLESGVKSFGAQYVDVEATQR